MHRIFCLRFRGRGGGRLSIYLDFCRLWDRRSDFPLLEYSVQIRERNSLLLLLLLNQVLALERGFHCAEEECCSSSGSNAMTSNRNSLEIPVPALC